MMMSNSNMEKNQITAEEHLESVTSTAQTDAILVEENLSYGASGFTGLFQSPYVFAAAFLASMGGFSFGYDQGVVSLILIMDRFHQQFPETAPGTPGYGFHTGFMTGMLELGAFAGCLFFPKLADAISRKRAIMVAVAFFFVGSIIQVASFNYGTLVAGRTIGGIGVGTLAMGAPLYIAEIAPPNLRGNLLVLEQFSIVVGAIIAFWIAYGTNQLQSDWCFRLPFLLQMVPAGILGVAINFFPYSPRWLAMKGRYDDCLDSLVKLRRVPADDLRIQMELKSIIVDVKFQEEVLRRDHPNSSTLGLEIQEWLDLFRPKTLKRTFIALGLPFFQQFSGINAFQYYAPTLFATLGLSKHMSTILTGLINIDQLAGVSITLFNMDRFGRRNLAIWGAVGMGIPHVIMAGIIAKYNNSWSSHSGVAWFGVALIYFYIFMYGLTYGPVGWALPAEVFPTSRRSKGVGLAVAVNWISNFIIGVAVPPMVIGIGYGTYIFFACFCALAAIFSYFFVPETAGKTLEQMDDVFGDNMGAEEKLMKAEILRKL